MVGAEFPCSHFCLLPLCEYCVYKHLNERWLRGWVEAKAECGDQFHEEGPTTVPNGSKLLGLWPAQANHLLNKIITHDYKLFIIRNFSLAICGFLFRSKHWMCPLTTCFTPNFYKKYKSLKENITKKVQKPEIKIIKKAKRCRAFESLEHIVEGP